MKTANRASQIPVAAAAGISRVAEALAEGGPEPVLRGAEPLPGRQLREQSGQVSRWAQIDTAGFHVSRNPGFHSAKRRGSPAKAPKVLLRASRTG